MIVYIDIDGTICTKCDYLNYISAKPIYENIEKANGLYDMGNTIVYWTARGTLSGVDWKSKTELQLKEWGVKYHELKFCKPAYDLFICDKAINVKDWI